MNRFEFIKSTKSILLLIPLVRVLKFDELSNIEPNRLDKTSDNFFPDKTNYLIDAKCIFRSPGWGDGKNEDKSNVDAYIDIECYDNLYSGQGGFGDKTNIETNIAREMPITFADSKKIFYDGVKNINVVILGHKPDQDSNQNDKWILRWEFWMKFKKGNEFATGYNDPAITYDFQKQQTPINFPADAHAGKQKYFARAKLFDHLTINSSN